MKTSPFFLLIALTVGLTVIPIAVEALPVDLSIPAGGLGPTRSTGAAQHWLELGDFDFGGGLALPLRLSFESDRTSGPTDFGDAGAKWWRSPALHARIFNNTAKELLLMLPCGKYLTLLKGGDPQAMATADGEWTAKLVDQVLTLSRADGWELEYGKGGWLVRLRTDAGRTLMWERGDSGRVASIYEQTANGRGISGLTVQRDPASGLVVGLQAHTPFGVRTHQMAYDAPHRLTKVTLHDGTGETYAYGETKAGQPQITITDRALISSTLTWDKTTHHLLSDGVWSYQIESKYATSYPRMTRNGPGGEMESFLDDSSNTGRVSFTAADGTITVRQTARNGPGKGQLESVTRIGAAADQPVMLYHATFDPQGNLATETDVLGHRTQHHYTLWGATRQQGIKTHTRTDATGAQTQEDYDAKGNLVSMTNALGHKTSFEYDGQNRRTRTLSQSGTGKPEPETVLEILAYNAQGQLDSRTDAAGAVTKFGYDKDGYRTTVTDALGNVTTDAFDPRGNRIQSTDALGHVWHYEYDLGNRLVKTFAPQGGSEKGQVKSEKGAGAGNAEAAPHPANPVNPVQTQPGTLVETRLYNPQGRLIAVTDADGNVARTEYDAFGRVTARTDALDRTTRYSYDVRQGAVGCTACNASSMPTLITLPSGRKIQRVYDADKHLIEETVGDDVRSPGAKAAATTKHEYDLAGNETKTTDPLGRTTQYQYDAANHRTKTTFPDQTTKTFAYNAAGQLTEETNELGQTSKRSYDAFGNLVTQTDAAGNVTTYVFGKAESSAYAALHRLTAMITPEGRITRSTYDLLGRRVTQTTGVLSEKSEVKSEKGVQDKPSVSSVKSAVKTGNDIAVSQHVFDAAGNEIETTDPSGKITKHRFDARKRRLTTTDALGRVWQYHYSASAGATGNAPCCGADPTSNARAVETVFPDGSKESRITDAAGQLIETIDAKGDHIRYAYDPDGRLTTLTDARGSVTRWSYDPRGKLESKVYPDKTSELYEHDVAGQLITRTRPDGTAAINTYDARGRLLSTVWKRTSFPAENGKPKMETDLSQLPGNSRYAYDAAGHLIQATNPSADIQRSYTATGKIASETQKVASTLAEPDLTTAPSYQVQYNYTPEGRIATMLYPDGSEVGYNYTARGQLADVSEQATENGQRKTVASYTYRKNGQVTEIALANGTKTVRTYDAVNRLEKVMHLNAGGTALWSETSRYDARDRRTARIHSEQSADLFAYDPAGQVIAAAYGQANVASASAEPNPNAQPKPDQWQQSFEYDSAGNRKQFQDIDGSKTAYQTNEANQYTALNSEKGQVKSEKDGNPSANPVDPVQTEPRYDPNGNLLKDTRNTYTWDADIHLLSVTTKNAESTKTTQFRYDALHRRVARLEADGTLTHFVHDGWNVLAEYQSSPGLQPGQTAQGAKPSSSPQPNAHELKLATTFIWGHDISNTAQGAGGITGLLAAHHPSSISHLPSSSHSDFFSYDSNGNVVLLTNAAGAESARYSYDAFGKTITATGEAAQSNKYRFSTKPIEDASGLAFYGYRYYSPELGRWTARDPLDEEKGGLHLYGMIGNDPISGVDVMGMDLFDEANSIVQNIINGMLGSFGLFIASYVANHAGCQQMSCSDEAEARNACCKSIKIALNLGAVALAATNFATCEIELAWLGGWQTIPCGLINGYGLYKMMDMVDQGLVGCPCSESGGFASNLKCEKKSLP